MKSTSGAAAPAVLASAASSASAKYPNLLLAAPQTIAVLPQPLISPAIQAALNKQPKHKIHAAVSTGGATITTFSSEVSP